MSTPAVVLEAARERRRRFAGNNVLVISCGVIIALAVFLAAFGPLLAPHDPDAANLGNAYVGPVAGHPLGYDSQGRDLFSRLLTGARTSMAGPFLVVLVSVTLGTTLAVTAAWAGRWLDATISTVLDILFAFPAILLAVLASAVFGAGLTAPTLALAIAYTPYVARVLRSASLQERSQPYIAALEVQGQTSTRICGLHLAPNVLGLIVAQGTILFSYAVVDLAAISFLGLGVQSPQADWGVMVSEGRSGVLQGYPAESLAAGLCIITVVIAVNLLGERLADRAQGGTR